MDWTSNVGGPQKPLHTPQTTENPSIYEVAGKNATPVSRSRDEPVQGSCHPSQFLHFFGISRRMQIANSLDLIWVDFNSVVSNQVSQEFAQVDPKKALGCVEVQFMFFQY